MRLAGRARLRWVDVEATNLAGLLTGWAATDGDRVAMIERVEIRRTLTWSELDRRVGAVAAGLVGHGLVAGHRVGILGPNSVTAARVVAQRVASASRS